MLSVLHEPAVTLTDYFLTIECALFAFVLLRRGVHTSWVLVFVGTAIAAAAGGTVHGFFPDPAAPAARVLWLVVMLSIGLTALALAMAATRIVWGDRIAFKVTRGLVVAYVGYVVVVELAGRDFLIAIGAYLPAAMFLMYAFAARWRHGRPDGAALAIGGVGLALVGAVVQRAGIGLHPVHFDHNALYHVVQAVALYLLFRAALEVEEARPLEPLGELRAT